MKLKYIIKDNLSQILAITEKNIKLKLRFKFDLIISFINPIVSILMPVIIMRTFLNLSSSSSLGPWNSFNFFLFQLTAYNLILIKGVVNEIPSQLRMEKFWQTLPALIIGPFNRINLLLGIFVTHLVTISIPFIIFLIVGLIYLPISAITVLSILFIFFLVALILSGIGLIIGIFAISNENIWRILSFGFTFIIWFSCITYPFELFPNIVQDIIQMNPLYYIFDLLRITWLNDNIVVALTIYPYNFMLLVLLAILAPMIGVIIFNKVYKKYGIVG